MINILYNIVTINAFILFTSDSFHNQIEFVVQHGER